MKGKNKLNLKIVHDKETGEFIIQWILNGKYSEAKTNYQSDKQDALLTRDAITEQYKDKYDIKHTGIKA